MNNNVNHTSPRPALWDEFLKAIRHEVIPAIGCTEPVSLALASAIATRHLGCLPDKIEALVSPNLMKNGMGVTVPGTGMVGLPIAAAMGALIGDPDEFGHRQADGRATHRSPPAGSNNAW